MNTDEQKQTLRTALAICKNLQDDLPNTVFFLVSEGRNHRYSIININVKADRQQLLANIATHIRATITPQCLQVDIHDQLLSAIQSELDVGYTQYGKTLNAYDLGDFITRAQQSIDATA